MFSPARRVSYRLLCQIELGRTFSDDALNSEHVAKLQGRDRSLTCEIVYGSLRWQALLDHVLAGASSRPLAQLEPRARILLRMSLYQMWLMDRVPDHAVVNDAVELAKGGMGRGIGGYLNGVLRHLSRDRSWAREGFVGKAPLWIQVSLPQWLWDRWAGRYGAEMAKDYALSLNSPPQAALRLVKQPGADAAIPFEIMPSDLVPGAYIRIANRTVPADRMAAECRYQDEASQLVPHLLGPTSGWRFWDACAAPGGKSAVLCEKCGETGQVFASDVRCERTLRLADFLSRVSRGNTHVLVADATRIPPFRKSFDAVLADVPCSGLGTLRRNPEIKWRFRPTELGLLQSRQVRILSSVARVVRVGGHLLYSTCSTEPEENEQVVGSFLADNPQFCLQRPLYPSGIERWIGKDDMVRTFPSTRLWDGFFAALMARRA